MTLPDLVLYDDEFRNIKESLQRLASDANANVVFLVDKNGQQIAAVGDLTTLDTTSLASLTAGNVAATLPAVSEASEVVSSVVRSPTAAICWPFLSTRNTTFAFASEASL